MLEDDKATTGRDSRGRQQDRSSDNQTGTRADNDSQGLLQWTLLCYMVSGYTPVPEAARLTQEGYVFEQTGNVEEALQHYSAALQADNQNVAALFQKAELLRRVGRFSEARQCYFELHSLIPTGPEASPHACMMHAQTLVNMGQSEEALLWFDRAIALEPLRGELWEMKGNHLAELGRYDEALQTFEAAQDQGHADNVRVLLGTCFCRGVILERQGSDAEAVSQLEVVTELDPDHTGAWYRKGLALNSRGCPSFS